MCRSLTQDDLDAEFEQFLKEPVSDDSVDLGFSDKEPHVRSSQKSNQKSAVSWWQDDEHSSGGAGEELAKHRFIKAKQPEPQINQVVSSESFHRPVPKPRTKALDKTIQSVKTPKVAATLDMSQTVETHKAPSEDSYSESLHSPADENLNSGSGQRHTDETDSPPVSTDGCSTGESDDALSESGTSFRKSFRKSQPIQEEDEEVEYAGLRDKGMEMALLTRDITEAEAGSSRTEQLAVPSDTCMNIVGLDTLEEEEEKARFFARLEAGASSTIDYSRLNRELDSPTSTTATNLRKAEEAALERSDEDQSKARVTETARESPDSPHYSEDFEDEEDDTKDPLDEKPKMSPNLARVSLYDSLGDTGGEDRRKDTTGSLGRGHSNIQSGGSEMEALQEAYRQIQTYENPDERHYLSLEGGWKHSRPTSPSSFPQPPSTTETDLPTAEDLMKPIRPENNQIRGFSLQTVSALELHQGNISQPLERTFPVNTHTESEQKQTGKAGLVAEVKEAQDLTNHLSKSPHSPNRDQTWTIRQEADRLMQDQNKYSSHTSSNASKAKKQQACRGSSVFHSSTSSERKPPVASVRSRTADRPKAVNSKLSGSNRAKTQSSITCAQHHPQKAKSPKTHERDERNSAELDGKLDGHLVASVQSLVAVLQQQVDTSRHQDAAREGPEETRQKHLPQISKYEESRLVEELRVQLTQKERELQMMKAEAEELKSLRQHNYLLQSKLQSAEESIQKRRWVDAVDPATEEKFKQIDKEIKEQETLIKGYQQENEKLYLQMKAQKARSKENQEAMFNENQRLLNELALAREQVKITSKPVGNVCVDHTQRISDLLSQISILQRNEDKLLEDNQRLRQQKQFLEVDLQLMKKERDLAKAQTISTSGDKAFVIHMLEDEHKEELAALKKKLKWFAENQELLDRDASRLKAATVEIHQLKEQVEKMKEEVGRRSSEQQKKARDKSADTRRVQDLERQVKELEKILRSKNQNSLPALIYAAATAAGREEMDSATNPSLSRINALLERRIQRLEAELESHDEEAKLTLRAMEQQFQRIKLRYEEQISELEQRLRQNHQTEAAAGPEPWESKCRTLEEEIKCVKESYQEKENSLLDQMESLQQQLKNKATPSPGRHQRQAEAAFGARIERLNQELATKTRSIQELSRTVDRLQKERRNMLYGPNPRADNRSAETRQQPSSTKALCAATEAETSAGPETFPAAPYEKTYQPTVFTGSHISEVLQENEALKQRVELLQLQSEKDKEALQADAVQAEEKLSRLKEHFAEQLYSVKTEHRRVLDTLRTTHALEHSASKVAELTNQLSTQEVAMKHLQEELKELQGSKEALAISMSRERTLQEQLTGLLQELKEAKDAQSSEVKLLCNIERKIINMELRHQHREKELQQVIGGAWQTSAADLPPGAERWKRLAQDKSRELAAFRLELDSILDILRYLQRQGVVLPTPEPPPHLPSSGGGDSKTPSESSYRELC